MEDEEDLYFQTFDVEWSGAMLPPVAGPPNSATASALITFDLTNLPNPNSLSNIFLRPVTNFITARFGNQPSKITAKDVAELRNYGPLLALKAREIICDYRPGAGIRLSPHFYTRDDELDAALDAIAEIKAGDGWRAFTAQRSAVT